MNNSKKDSSKSMRYKEGPKRSFRPNEWYLNQKAHSETDKFFSSSKGGVPNNPENANSFRPISAPINPKESMSGDFVKRKNPYGDGGSSKKIIRILENLNYDNLLKKKFFNISIKR